MDECLLDTSWLEHVFSLRVRGMYNDTVLFFKQMYSSPSLGFTL